MLPVRFALATAHMHHWVSRILMMYDLITAVCFLQVTIARYSDVMSRRVQVQDCAFNDDAALNVYHYKQ